MSAAIEAMEARAIKYCRIVGLTKIHYRPMDYALLQLTLMTSDLVDKIQRSKAELRKALCNPSDPDSLSSEAQWLVNVLMQNADTTERKAILSYLRRCPVRLVERPQVRPIVA